MSIKIALAGNPNCGKTTLFNALTGSNQYVGNWPGVTVEKKEGKLKSDKDVVIMDLPGIYSLSPYTLEEVVARNYLITERPDAILNIIDGTNLERNLYLTTQLIELGIPMVIAVNMLDILQKRGDVINLKELSSRLGCEVYEISALKGTGIDKAVDAVVKEAKSGKSIKAVHSFSKDIEAILDIIAQKLPNDIPVEQRRFYAVKLFERDGKIAEIKDNLPDVEDIIKAAEEQFDDDSESIITNERYTYISSIIKGCFKKKSKNAVTVSDKIDRVVTNRWLALPIFAIVMIIVYYVSVTSVGTVFTDWMNDGVFGDGWYLLSIGRGEYESAAGEFGDASAVVDAFIEAAGENGQEIAEAVNAESEDFDSAAAVKTLDGFAAEIDDNAKVTYTVEDEETLATEDVTVTGATLKDSIAVLEKYEFAEPDPSEYGIWVPGIPALLGNLLESINCADWLNGLIMDGIVAGVGAVLGFVPQILILFIFLAFLEGCGYMARVAFIMDRIFRKFGLSGKSFIPMLIGSGCGVPGIMASRTIENERDRRMTIMTTTFIPCSAKLPFIAMIAGAIFGGAWWVSPLAYFIGVAAIIISGIILKKTKMFSGDPAPFVMELPSYHLPTVGSVLRSMWERGWSFIKRAGTIILVSTILVWFTTYFGVVDGSFRMLSEEEIDHSILAAIGNCFAWLFIPLGWGNWQSAVASITGLVAKENIVGTMGILYGGNGSVYQNLANAFAVSSGLSFLIFNLLCAPCFAAIGAIKREMNNAKWTWFAIGYQCIFAYAIALCVYQFGNLFIGGGFDPFIILAVAVVALIVYMLVRPYKESNRLTTDTKLKV